MINCIAALSFCDYKLAAPFQLTGKSPHFILLVFVLTEDMHAAGKSVYDIRTECIGEVRDTLCYPATKSVTVRTSLTTFLNPISKTNS